jgi:hypothetical protein
MMVPMKHRVEAASDGGLIVFHDIGAECVALVAEGGASRRWIPDGVRDGSCFVIDADDAVSYRLDVFVEEEPSGLAEHRCRPLGGAHLLRIPSGRLVVEGAEAWADGLCGEENAVDLDPGDYALSLLGRDEYDETEIQREYAGIVGEADLRLRTWIDRTGLVGCVTTALSALAIVLPWTREWWPWVLILLILSWAPFHLLRLLPRYRSVEAKIGEYEKRLPHYTVELQRVDDSGHLRGGSLRVD